MSDQELRDRVLAFLRGHQTAVLGSLSPGGEPQGATVTGAWDDGFSFYFFTRRDSRKFRNLAVNPHVSVVVGFEPDTRGTVQAQGTATMVGDHTQLAPYAEIIDTGAWPLLRQQGMDFIFFKVEVDWLRWLDVTRTQEAGEDVFFQILPSA